MTITSGFREASQAFFTQANQLVEVDLPRCKHVFGQGQCRAIADADGTKCSYTFASCQDPMRFEAETFTRYYSSTNYPGVLVTESEVEVLPNGDAEDWEGGAPTGWNVLATPYLSGTQITNGNFNSFATSGQPVAWFVSFPSDYYRTTNSFDSYNGNYSFFIEKYKPTAGGYIQASGITLTPGEDYHLRIRYKVENWNCSSGLAFAIGKRTNPIGSVADRYVRPDTGQFYDVDNSFFWSWNRVGKQGTWHLMDWTFHVPSSYSAGNDYSVLGVMDDFPISGQVWIDEIQVYHCPSGAIQYGAHHLIPDPNAYKEGDPDDNLYSFGTQCFHFYGESSGVLGLSYTASGFEPSGWCRVQAYVGRGEHSALIYCQVHDETRDQYLDSNMNWTGTPSYVNRGEKILWYDYTFCFQMPSGYQSSDSLTLTVGADVLNDDHGFYVDNISWKKNLDLGRLSLPLLSKPIDYPLEIDIIKGDNKARKTSLRFNADWQPHNEHYDKGVWNTIIHRPSENSIHLSGVYTSGTSIINTSGQLMPYPMEGIEDDCFIHVDYDYDIYRPSSDTANVLVRVSTDGGETWRQLARHYLNGTGSEVIYTRLGDRIDLSQVQLQAAVQMLYTTTSGNTADIQVNDWYVEAGNHRGEYWTRLLAANPNYDGRDVRIRQGFQTLETDDWHLMADMRMNKWSSKRQVTQIECLDKLTDALNKAQLPMEVPEDVKIITESGIFPSDTILKVDSNRVIPDPASLPSGLKVIIEVGGTEDFQDDTNIGEGVPKEYMQVTAISGAGQDNEYLIVDRGHYGTTATTFLPVSGVSNFVWRHVYFAGEEGTNTPGQEDFTKNAVDVVRDLVKWTGIADADVDEDSFTLMKNLYYPSLNLSRKITDEKKVKELMQELRQLLSCAIYPNENNEIEFRVLGPPSPSEPIYRFNDREHIIDGSVQITDDPAYRITGALCYYSPIEEDPGDDPSKYKRVAGIIDGELISEKNFGSDGARSDHLFTEWFKDDESPATVRDILQKRLRLRAYGVREIQFQVHIKDSVAEVGDYAYITVDEAQNHVGFPEEKLYFITSKKQKDEVTAEYKAIETDEYATGFLFIGPADMATSFATAGREDKGIGYFGDENNLLTNEDGQSVVGYRFL